MVSAPQINEKELIARLNQLYNLDITNIQFFPKGETSWGYLVTTADTKFWLKIYNKSFSYLEDAAELTYTLFSKCHITEIVHAIPSNTGKAVNQFENYSFVLFNFIEGKELMGQELTDSQREQLGILMGKIHKATEIIGHYPKKETFESKDKEMFLQVTQRIKTHQENETKEQKEFIDLLQPFQERIMQQLLALEEITQKLRKREIPFVICHSDPNPANILLGNDGELYILDWDAPMLAPKERDLFMFDNGIDAFMKGYISIVGETQIDTQVREFYAKEWNVQEIANFGEKILFEENSEIDNQHYLERTKELLAYSGIKAV